MKVEQAEQLDLTLQENTSCPVRIVPESEHPIREHQLDREALKVLYRLRDAGFKGYLVGGGVRDLYLGKKPKDFDISTDARPGQLRQLFRNSRTIGRRFRLVQVFFRGNKIIEVSTLRSRNEYDQNGGNELLASNNAFGTLEEDAFRRDLTINSLFYEIEGHTVIDYVGGVEDLNQGVIRMVGDPDRRFSRDPVRMMRAIRHAARTGFAIEAVTAAAIERNMHSLPLCPPSRLRDELLKDLQSGASRAWGEQCMASALWSMLFPFYAKAHLSASTVQTLLRIFSIFDRMHQAGSEDHPIKIADYFLFSALLLPWACEHFNILDLKPRGPRFSTLMSRMRDRIEREFAQPYNLSAMVKTQLCTLLTNFPFFHQAPRKDGEYPAWLKKKSYYADASLLYDLYLNIHTSGEDGFERERFLSRHKDLPQLEVIKAVLENPLQSNEPQAGRGRGNPSYSKQDGGVFGFRRGHWRPSNE